MQANLVMNILEFTHLSLIQLSILKCLNKYFRDYVASRDTYRLRLYSYELFCYFNISPSVFGDHILRKKFERDLIDSNDVGYVAAMIDIGWKYNYETMSIGIERGMSVRMMKCLRDFGCHWGSTTMDKIIERNAHEHMRFALIDGYPITEDHAIHAIELGDITTIKLVVNAFIETAQMSWTSAIGVGNLSKEFKARLSREVNADGTDEDTQKINEYYMTLCAIKWCVY
jgi:hypothetical protein